MNALHHALVTSTVTALLSISAALGQGTLSTNGQPLRWVDDGTIARAADFDGDGRPDLLGGAGLLPQVRFQVGPHRFEARAPLPPIHEVRHADPRPAVGDLNGDGLPDVLLVVNRPQRLPEVYVLINRDGDIGSAAVHVPGIALPRYTTWVNHPWLGDLDGDGDLDALIGSDRSIHVLINVGAGSFVDESQRIPPLPLGRDDFTQAGIALGDVDGDGDLDVAVGGAHLLRNRGSGSFAAEPLPFPPPTHGFARMQFADMDGDGDVDLIGTPSYYAENVGGTLVDRSATAPAVLATLGEVFTGDLDGDGDIDALLSTNDGVAVLDNDGSGVLTHRGQTQLLVSPASINGLTDLDRDGDLDAVGGRSAFYNDGSGRLTEQPYELPGRGTPVDIDRDGDLDLFFGEGGAPFVARNDGRGNFDGIEPVSGMPSIRSSTGLANVQLQDLGDLDGDGWPDFVGLPAAASGAGPGVIVAMNDRTGRWSVGADRFAGLTSAVAVRLGDVDGDGDPDAAVATWLPPGIIEWSIWTNNGTGMFTRAQLLTAGPGLTSATWFDVEEDGDLDLLLAGLGAIQVFENDGSGSFAAVAAALPAGGEQGRPTVLDADGDGRTDLFVRVSFGDHRLFLRRNTGWFDASATHLPAPLYDGWVHDGNGDGAPDLYDLHAGVYVLNDGTGRFVDRVRSDMLDADLDGDGDPDAPSGSSGAERHLVLENPLRPGRSARLGCHFRAGYNPTATSMWVMLASDVLQTPNPLAGGSSLFVDPSRAVLVGAAAVARGSGYGQLSFGIPATATLVGQPVHLQGFVLGGSSAFGTNVLRGYVHPGATRP